MRSFKINDQTLKNLFMEEQNRNNYNSQNFNSLPIFGDRRLTLSSNTLSVMPERDKKPTQPKTDIFKGRKFYFPPEVFNDDNYYK